MSTKTSRFVKDKYFFKSFFALLIPMTLQSVIGVAANFTDNLMVAEYSEITFSGIGVANQVQFILNMIIGGIGSAVVVLISQYFGQKKEDSIKKVVSTGFQVSIVISSLFFIIVILFPRQILSLFTYEKAVIDEGIIYITCICFSYVLIALSNVLASTLSAIKKPVVSFTIITVTTIIDVFLNWLFIYGIGPFPEMGGFGAALSTVIMKAIEVTALFVYLFFADKQVNLKPKNLLVIDKVMYKNFFKVALPVMLSGASWGISMGIQASILGHLGQPVIAANTAASNIFSFVVVGLGASSGVASILVGNAVGRGDMIEIKQYTNTIQVMLVIMGIFSGITLFLLKDILAPLFQVGPESYKLLIAFLTVQSVTIIGTAYQMPTLGGIVKGGGDTRFVLVNDLIFQWLIILPISYIAAYVLKLSPIIVFACLKSDQILKCFVAFFKVNSYNWIKKFD